MKETVINYQRLAELHEAQSFQPESSFHESAGNVQHRPPQKMRSKLKIMKTITEDRLTNYNPICVLES